MAPKDEKQSREVTVRRIRLFFSVIMILSGMCIMAYPFVSNVFAEHNATVAIENYSNTVEEMDEEKLDALKAAAEAYNQQLNTVIFHGEAASGSATYADIVGVGESLGYITIPKINVSLPMYEGTDESVLRRGVGHMPMTSYPLGGESTHCVLTGHRGLPEAVLFTDLDQLEIGDKFYLHTLDEVLAYQVDQVKVVEPNETKDLEIIKGEDHCTLVTCTPYGINSHRLLVRGVRVEYTGEEEETAAILQYQQLQTGTIVRRLLNIWPWMLVALVGIVGVEFMLMVLIVRRHRRRRKED